VAIQKSLAEAEEARDAALAAARKQKETADDQATLRRLLAAGDQNLRAKRYDAAIVAFTDALKLSPADAKAKAGLEQAQAAQASMKLDARAQAEAKRKRDEYEKAMRQGRAALNLKQYSDALGLFQKAQELLPGDTASAELIEDVTKRKADAEGAQLTQKKTAELNQAIAAGRAALRAKKFDEAQAAADRAAKIDADHAALKKLAADIDAQRKAYAAAMPKKETGDAEARKRQAAYELAMRSAQSALTARRYDNAIRHATEALRLKPDDPAATQVLAAAKKADTAADSAAMEAKKKQEAYLLALREASAAQAAKRYDAAIKAAREALALKPRDVAATKILNDAQRALDAADTATMEAQKKKEAYDKAMTAGRAALAKKDFDDAIKAFNDALRADPRDPAATALLKQAREGQSAMAADAKRKELYDGWLDRAEKMMAARRFGLAEEAYENALKAQPGDPKATRGLAEARAAMAAKKDPPDKVDPKKDPPPQKGPPPKKGPDLAAIAALLKEAAGQESAGKYSEAYATYQEVLKIAPANPTARRQAQFCQWMDQGSRQLAAGNLAEAAASFQQALKLDPTDARARKLLQQARPPKKKK
jgi:tetratricopeptide (TPR) repeat protein